MLLVNCPMHENVLYPDVKNPADGIQEEIPVLFSPAPDHTWTFMIYLDSANNLEPHAINDINEMEYGLYLASLQNPGILNNLDIIVLWDRITGYYTDPVNDWTDTRLYKILPDSAPGGSIVSQQLFDVYGNFGFAADTLNPVERNMGSRATLRDFMDYAATYYPADHIALVLWDHGNGPLSFLNNAVEVTSRQPVRGIAVDDESPNSDMLSTEEFCNAITGSIALVLNGKLDIVGFDACLMGSVEIAYELRNVADYMAASMANEWQPGWDYSLLFGAMNSSAGEPTGRELAQLMVKAYRDSTVHAAQNNSQTLAAVDLGQMETLKSAIDTFAVAMYQENCKSQLETMRDAAYAFVDLKNEYDAIKCPYFDLNDLCYRITANRSFFSSGLISSAQGVITELGVVVVAAYSDSQYGGYYGTGSTLKRGLFIVFPLGDRTQAGTSYYDSADWYTSVLLQYENADGSYLGHLDFCSFNNNYLVETWTELLEAWYDPANTLVPWNSF